jgi:hypothetical protein
MEVCGVNKKNLGTGLCNDLPQILRRHITTAEDFVATKVQVESRTFWQEQIALGNAYYWPAYSDVPEYIGTETTYRDNPVNYSKVIAGRYRWRVKIEKNLCFHKAANSHSGRGGRVWLVDGASRIFGTYAGDNSGVATYGGFTMDLLDAENLMFNDGTNPSESPFVIALSNPVEVNDAVFGAYGFNTPWMGLLQPLTDVVLEIVSADASEIVLKAYLACDGTPVKGLELADFTVVDADGDPVTFGGGTEGPDGTYTLTSSATFSSGDVVDLKDADDLSVYPQSVYEGIPVTVTVPFPSV